MMMLLHTIPLRMRRRTTKIENIRMLQFFRKHHINESFFSPNIFKSMNVMSVTPLFCRKECLAAARDIGDHFDGFPTQKLVRLFRR